MGDQFRRVSGLHRAAAAFALSGTFALAQSGTGSAGGSSATGTGTNTGSSTTGTTGSTAGSSARGPASPNSTPEPIRQHTRSQRFAKRIDADGPRLRYGQIKIKKASRNAGPFFIIFMGTVTTFPNVNCSRNQRSCYLPLVSTFCFSSSFIFLTVGSWWAAPVV
jgi:hypothetical protein